MQKINPFLWFNDQAEEAANFYVSVFKNSKIIKVARYGAAAARASGRPKGSVMTVEFQLEGQQFVALNGGPVFTFSPAISFVVNCQAQTEVDALWERLCAGGEKSRCGWLKDRHGVSWQIIPLALVEILNDPDGVKSERVMKAMLKMDKIDIAALQRAFAGPKARKK